MNQPLAAEEAALFSVLLEAAADAIIVIDEVGTVRQANSACARVFGYELPEILGRNIKMLMPENYRREHDGYLRRYRETGESKIIGVGRQVEGRRSDGVVFPMDLSVGEGSFSGERLYVGIVRDLTERHALLQTLQEQEAELRQMMDSAVVPTGLVDGKGRLLVANEALNSFLACDGSADVELGSYLSADTQVQSLGAALDEAAKAPTVCVLALLAFEVDGHRKSGDLYLASFPRHAHNDDHGIVVQLVDRTAQLEAEKEAREIREELAHYQRISALTAMTAGIAHEVNQPMGAIANYAEAGQILVRKDQVPAEELERIFKQIGQQADRAADVIRRLRSLAGGQSPAREALSASEIVNDTLHLYRSQLELLVVRVEKEYEAELPLVFVDRVQIQQVLLNLLQNAVDSMTQHPEAAIRVSARSAEAGLVIAVEDRGTGISASIAERLTDPFFTSKTDGMGIGLAVCRTIVEKHGGRLWFENNAGGRGATFSFLLPGAEGGTDG